jgi:hypothetical protein
MEIQRKINFQESRDFGELINVTFEFIRQNFLPLGKALLYIAGPFVVLSGIFTSTVMIKTMAKFPVDQSVSLTDLVSYMSSYSLMNYIFMFITNSVIAGVVYEYIVLYIHEGPDNFTLTDLIETLQTDALHLLGIMFLSTILITAGMLLFILPGIYLGVLLSPILIIALFENLDYAEAFERCRMLLSGYWWYTFGLLLVVIIIQTILMMAISFPINIVSQAFMGPASGALTKSSQIILIVSSIISSVNYFLYSIPMITVAFHYFNLMQRKEGIGYID